MAENVLYVVHLEGKEFLVLNGVIIYELRHEDPVSLAHVSSARDIGLALREATAMPCRTLDYTSSSARMEAVVQGHCPSWAITDRELAVAAVRAHEATHPEQDKVIEGVETFRELLVHTIRTLEEQRLVDVALKESSFSNTRCKIMCEGFLSIYDWEQKRLASDKDSAHA